ncbi:MAG: hypothetical protein ABRQ29_08140 [Smithellaceae bacterium]|jgi:hypothetical protein
MFKDVIAFADQNRINKKNDFANGALIVQVAGNMIAAHPFEDFQGILVFQPVHIQYSFRAAIDTGNRCHDRLLLRIGILMNKFATLLSVLKLNSFKKIIINNKGCCQDNNVAMQKFFIIFEVWSFVAYTLYLQIYV